MPLKNAFRLALVLYAAIFSGCSTKETVYTPTEADQKFTKILTEEFHYTPALKQIGKSLWVYLPFEHAILAFKAGAQQPAQSERKFSLVYLDGKFEDGHFVIEFDIIPFIKSSKNKGVATSYTEAFNKEYQNLISAVSRVYLNAQKPPDFIVAIFADIKNGIEVINTFNLDDFRKYQSLVLPYEEYLLRVLNDSKGNKNIINDNKGNHIVYSDIAWPDFIIKQIVNRINFKYQQSD